MTPVCLHYKTFCKYFTMKIFVCLHYKTFCKYFTMKIFVCLHYKTFFASISPWAEMHTKSFIVKLMTTRMNSWSKNLKKKNQNIHYALHWCFWCKAMEFTKKNQSLH